MDALTVLEKCFGWLLQATWQAAVIVGLILLAQFVLRNRLSPAWRYSLWLLLVARLVMPITPPSAVSIYNLAKWPRPQAVSIAPASTPPLQASSFSHAEPPMANAGEVQTLAVPASPIEKTVSPIQATATVTSSEITTLPSSPRPAKSVNWTILAAATWFTVTLALLGRFVWMDLRFHRRLANYVPMCDDEVTQLATQCAESLGLKQLPLIIETEEVDSPAVYGLLRKRLLLPDGLREQLSPDQLRHILLHELAHIKRRDPEMNWLMSLLQIAHWFNPALWFAFARMRADREVATDDLALTHTHAQDRLSYGETILRLLDGLRQRRALPALIGMAHSKKQMKERIRAIARGSIGPRWRWMACATAIGIASIALTSARNEKAKEVNLLEVYPTTLTAGDDDPNNAREWQFNEKNIFQVSRFALDVGKQLHVEAGISDLGIGHCADGAVWAVLIPRTNGIITSSATTNKEAIAHVWLRFHPSQINKIFPPETVSDSESMDLVEEMQSIANFKMRSSWHAGNNVMIPEPKEIIVDVDTKSGPRRFFGVDKNAQTAEYCAAFADNGLQTIAIAGESKFEQDTNYASVVSVSPANGAKDVDCVQDLRIRFDRPMDPHKVKLQWKHGGFQLNGDIRTEANQTEFIIPVRLTPGEEQKLIINDSWGALGPKVTPEARRDLARVKGGFLDINSGFANEFKWSFKTKRAVAAKPGATKPIIASILPTSGTTNAPVLAIMKVAFDQPMQPPSQRFPFLQKKPVSEGPSMLPSFSYDPATHEFTFPVLLRSEDDVRLSLNGFFSAEGVPSDPIVLHYQTGKKKLDTSYEELFKASAKNPDLKKLLGKMKEARERLQSGIETVQEVGMSLSSNAFNQIEAKTTIFKWQGTHQVYADITGIMSTPAFILGCDGKNCWLYSEDSEGKKRLDQTPVEKTKTRISILDPFDLASRSLDKAMTQVAMVYQGKAMLEGQSCYLLQKYDVSTQGNVFATLTQWWIDEKTLLPKQIVQYFPESCHTVRYGYKDLNQPLPESAFRPPAASHDNAEPLFFADEPKPGEERFFHISDGSNGRMSGRIGWQGPQGTTSSGLN